MSVPSTGQSAPDPQAGIERIERFLAAASERTQALQAAEAFADHLPSLTSTERQQLVRLYVGERLVEVRRRRKQIAQQEAVQDVRERLRGRCIRIGLLLGLFSASLTLWLIVDIVM
ncbi:hypothetical protein ABZY19_21600 [Streptomyces sp. NPDC006475]|uniref:hypothetical protein n=1 Tax=Streptomyces sp. NPDC006475 TaxID=3155719 RepID=UPI0033A009D4